MLLLSPVRNADRRSDLARRRMVQPGEGVELETGEAEAV
jgi:hypothetical protein